MKLLILISTIVLAVGLQSPNDEQNVDLVYLLLNQNKYFSKIIKENDLKRMKDVQTMFPMLSYHHNILRNLSQNYLKLTKDIESMSFMLVNYDQRISDIETHFQK
jgi:hypothetical protein